MKKPILGCIADDLTGATDLCNNLVRAGMRVILTIDVPLKSDSLHADAIVVALKSRTIPAAKAVEQSLHACRWLRNQGVQQIYFKICSTFDSTIEGNIGPVIEALMDQLDCDFSCVVPAFPDNDRTVYKGHLFVGDLLLSDSGMRNHPLTPMTDANLVRFLQLQLSSERRRKTGLIDYRTVSQSGDAVRERIAKLRAQGISIAIADSVSNADIERLASALHGDILVTAGSGLAKSLPGQLGFSESEESAQLPFATGRRLIVSGSCSVATNSQVRSFIQCGGAARSLNPIELAADGDAQIEHVLAWSESCWSRDPNQAILVYSTAEPAAVREVHARFGVERSGELVEQALSAISRALVMRGAGQLVVAGGETAGVCIRALDIEQMQIGPQIDPGVPWCFASSPLSPRGSIHVALKSGNFGGEDFFNKAFSVLL
jgi:uncharacterized protein YgbK (DUF1537 family)